MQRNTIIAYCFALFHVRASVSVQSESFFEAHQATGNKSDARARFGMIDSLMARKLINHQQNCFSAFAGCEEGATMGKVHGSSKARRRISLTRERFASVSSSYNLLSASNLSHSLRHFWRMQTHGTATCCIMECSGDIYTDTGRLRYFRVMGNVRIKLELRGTLICRIKSSLTMRVFGSCLFNPPLQCLLSASR